MGKGENENRNVLDAFFLGKALAEVINERIESTVGEVLGNIGRFQAEQQRQVQEIQVLQLSFSLRYSCPWISSCQGQLYIYQKKTLDCW